MPPPPGLLLLTAPNSRVGGRLLRHLRREGADVRAFYWMRRATAPARPDTMAGDLLDPSTRRRAVDGATTVVHIAAWHDGLGVDDAVAVNRAATRGLAAASIAAGVRCFVLVSSYLVYGTGLGRPAREDDPVAVRAGVPFGAAKIGAERGLAELDTAGMEVRVLRVGYSYGEADPHLAELLVWTRELAGSKRVHLVHHADVRAAVYAAARPGGGAQRVFNVADDAPVTVREVREAVGAGVPAERQVRPLAEQPWSELLGAADPWEGTLDATAIRRHLGFRPVYPTIHAAVRAGRI